jgi:hypothetical protein
MNLESSNKEVNRHWGQLGQSLLNGMIGEYLEKENNPLAIQMGFFHQSQKLSLDCQLAQQLDCPLSNKVVIFVHGLTNLETVWDYPAEGSSNASIVNHYIDVCFSPVNKTSPENYGKKLQEEFGFTPFYLRYNTGLSLEKNGRNFSAQLSKLFKNYPIKIDDLMLIGFSMGGGLLSHAQYSAQKNNQAWLKVLSKCMYLGDSSENSLLANILQLSGDFLRHTPIRYINFLADWFDYRSKRLQTNENKENDFDLKRRRSREFALFVESSRHYFVNGNLTRKGQNIYNRSIEDLNPKQKNSDSSRATPPRSQSVHLEGISPIRLAHSNRVYSLISRWVKAQDLKDGCEQSKAPELVLYNSLQEASFEEETFLGSSNKAFIAGTVDLVASAYDKTVETFETMHYSIVEEPFYALEKLPIASQIAKPVGVAQRDMLDNVYRSLRSGGRMMHKFAADIAADEFELKKTV